MSMYHNDPYNDGLNTGRRIAGGCIIASLAILAVLGITLAANRKEMPGHTAQPAVSSESAAESTSYETGTDTLTSDQLGFWNMYDKDSNAVISGNDGELSDDRVPDKRPQEPPVSGNMTGVSGNRPVSANSAVSDNQFNIAEQTEEPEYAETDDTLKKSSLFGEGFKKDGDKLVYALNGRKTSHFGIDVSKYNGEIKWNQVKDAGVEFAMLRIGSRGYSSGTINLDDTFQKNYDGCSSNGIDVGCYFYSQAVNINEAIEEANYCVAALNGRKIKYPIMFDSEAVQNDSYRTQNLSQKDLSDCAVAFCTTVEHYGYLSMIGGTKRQLVKHMDLRELSMYDICIFDTDEQSVYPYRYTMRQYKTDGKVDGISGNVDYDICFISYADK